MSDRTCARCGHRFKYPSGLTKHIHKRLTPCKQHAETALAHLPVATVNGHDDIAERLRNIERRLNEFTCAAPTIIQQNNYMNNVTVNIFGHESISHISNEDIMHLFDKAVLRDHPDQLFTDAAMLIYSDPEHPENITAYIPSSGGASNNKVMVYTADANWKQIPLTQATPPMVKKTLDLLADRQPFHAGSNSLTKYGQLLSQVFKNETAYSVDGRQLRTVLVRNREYIPGAV